MIRQIRLEEKKSSEKAQLINSFSYICIGALFLAIFYCGIEVLNMHSTLKDEEAKLKQIQDEYKTYKATQMTIDKEDIKLLNTLQQNRIFWSKKLASMAQFLPENYWITEFGYERGTYNVKGYGYITQKQEQLITMDDYLNLLRKDSNFVDVFTNTYLDMTKRVDEDNRERISFTYSAVGSVKK